MADASGELEEKVYALGRAIACPICLSLMDNPARLPCLHYFCWSCITHNVRSRGEVFCPVCRGKTNRREIQADTKMATISKLYGQLEAALGKPMLLSQLPDAIEPPLPLSPAAAAVLDLDPTAAAQVRPQAQRARRSSGTAGKAAAAATVPVVGNRRGSTRRRSQPGAVAGAAAAAAVAATPTPSPAKLACNGCSAGVVATTGNAVQPAITRAAAVAGMQATSAAVDANAKPVVLREVSDTAAEGGTAAQRRSCGGGDLVGSNAGGGGGSDSAAPAPDGAGGMKRRRLGPAGMRKTGASGAAAVTAPPPPAAAAAAASLPPRLFSFLDPTGEDESPLSECTLTATAATATAGDTAGGDDCGGGTGDDEGVTQSPSVHDDGRRDGRGAASGRVSSLGGKLGKPPPGSPEDGPLQPQPQPPGRGGGGGGGGGGGANKRGGKRRGSQAEGISDLWQLIVNSQDLPPPSQQQEKQKRPQQQQQREQQHAAEVSEDKGARQAADAADASSGRDPWVGGAGPPPLLPAQAGAGAVEEYAATDAAKAEAAIILGTGAGGNPPLPAAANTLLEPPPAGNDVCAPQQPLPHLQIQSPIHQPQPQQRPEDNDEARKGRGRARRLSRGSDGGRGGSRGSGDRTAGGAAAAAMLEAAPAVTSSMPVVTAADAAAAIPDLAAIRQSAGRHERCAGRLRTLRGVNANSAAEAGTVSVPRAPAVIVGVNEAAAEGGVTVPVCVVECLPGRSRGAVSSRAQGPKMANRDDGDCDGDGGSGTLTPWATTPVVLPLSSVHHPGARDLAAVTADAVDNHVTPVGNGNARGNGSSTPLPPSATAAAAPTPLCVGADVGATAAAAVAAAAAMRHTPAAGVLLPVLRGSCVASPRDAAAAAQDEAVPAADRGSGGGSGAAAEPMLPESGGPATVGGSRRVPSRLLPWSCPTCTFDNKAASKRCAMCNTDKPRRGADGGMGQSSGAGSGGGRGESGRMGGRRAATAAVAVAAGGPVPTPRALEGPSQLGRQVVTSADRNSGGDGGLMRTTPIVRIEAPHESEPKGLRTVEGTSESSKRRKIQEELLRQPQHQHLPSGIAKVPPPPHPPPPPPPSPQQQKPLGAQLAGLVSGPLTAPSRSGKVPEGGTGDLNAELSGAREEGPGRPAGAMMAAAAAAAAGPTPHGASGSKAAAAKVGVKRRRASAPAGTAAAPSTGLVSPNVAMATSPDSAAPSVGPAAVVEKERDPESGVPEKSARGGQRAAAVAKQRRSLPGGLLPAAATVTPRLPPPPVAAVAVDAAAGGSRRRASAAGACGSGSSRKKPRLSPHSTDGTSAAATADAIVSPVAVAGGQRKAECSPTGGDDGVNAGGAQLQRHHHPLQQQIGNSGGGGGGGRWLQPCPSWVLLGSALDDGPAGKGLLKRLAAASGGRVVEQYQPAVTHVLCGTDAARRARRTFKYLMGVAHGAWVLDVGWAAACLSAGHALPEEGEFAVLGDQTGGICGAAEARRRRLLRQQQQQQQQGQHAQQQRRRRRSSGTSLLRNCTSPTAGVAAPVVSAVIAQETDENTSSPSAAYGSGGGGSGCSNRGRSGVAAAAGRPVAEGAVSPKVVMVVPVDVGAGNEITAEPQLHQQLHDQQGADPNPDQDPDLNHMAVSETTATAAPAPAPAAQMDTTDVVVVVVGERAEAACGLLLEGVRIHISVGAAVKDDVTALARALGATLLQRIPHPAAAGGGGASANRTQRDKGEDIKRKSRQQPPSSPPPPLPQPPQQQQQQQKPDCTAHPEGVTEAGVDDGTVTPAAPPLPDPLLLVDPELVTASGGAAARQFSAMATAAAALGVPLVSYKWLMTCAGSYSAEPWLQYKLER